MNLTHLTEVLRENVWLALGIGVGSFVVSIGATIVVVIRIPEDYFVTDEAPLPFQGHSLFLRWAARIGRNLLGAIVVALGIVMSLPGVPGQGLLTILFGVMLLDIPGKRSLERRLVRRPAIHKAINRLRARYKKPPIAIGPNPNDSQPMASAPKSPSGD